MSPNVQAKPEADESSPKLRALPRQGRSKATITQILDGADRAIERLSVDNVTTIEVAEEAGVSIGRLYYWFSDMDALFEALKERNYERLREHLQQAFVEVGDLTTPQLVSKIFDEFMDFTRTNPATIAIIRDTATADESDSPSIHHLLITLIGAIIEIRVPTSTAAERTMVADFVLGIVLAAADAIVSANNGAEAAHYRQEVVYVLCAYLSSRYPAPDYQVWEDETSFIRPARPAASLVMNEAVQPATPA